MRLMRFAETIGHEKQKLVFDQLIKNGNLSHAYAFSGPAHIGKTTLARELAKNLGADPARDLAVFDSVEGLTIEEARALQSRLQLSPVGKWKVAVVSNAERMGKAAASSLLKTLEEPPAHSLLILVTSNFHAFLPTIASRLQRINFGKNTDGEVAAALAKFNLPSADSSRIAVFASGRIGLALLLAENESLRKFYEAAAAEYGILLEGSLLKRLQTAQMLAELPTEDLQRFVKIGMDFWVEANGPAKVATKLQVAYQDLEFHVNTKLVLDNLFLP